LKIEKNNEKRNSTDRILSRYKINVLIDNSKTEGAPVIFERFPSYYNLFGRIEYVNKGGSYLTDFSLIKAGSIHKANGGYLIIEADELLSEPLAYSGLKRLLKSKMIKIENISESYSLYPTLTLRPEQIPLDVKIILIGNQYIYNMLYYYDEEFRKLFKIRVEFDYEMNNNTNNIAALLSFIDYVSKRENIKSFTKFAKREIVKYSIIQSDTRKKITTKLSEIVNLMLESDSIAEGNKVRKDDVIKALNDRKYRGNLYEEKMMEMFKENKILIDVQGSKPGQINGLVVVFSGEHEFGFPIKITSRTFKGNAGVVDIEREVKLGGNVHSKAVMILTGFIGAKYKIDSPLSFTSTISHEQVYGPIEGDSATLAETIVLLSSIANIPIKQNYAITGSMDQFGKAQPVGGIKHKVEGFYNSCKAKGIIEGVGVVLPKTNIDDLVLSDEVVQAVRKGNFELYAIDNIDEAIEIMTGLKAGKANSKGKYPRGTFHYRVQKALETLSKDEETKRRTTKRRR
jgi:lon-related putative ATP-dependent protease